MEQNAKPENKLCPLIVQNLDLTYHPIIELHFLLLQVYNAMTTLQPPLKSFFGQHWTGTLKETLNGANLTPRLPTLGH